MDYKKERKAFDIVDIKKEENWLERKIGKIRTFCNNYKYVTNMFTSNNSSIAYIKF